MKKEITVNIEGKDFILKKHSYRVLMFLEEYVKENPSESKSQIRENLLLLFAYLKVHNEDFEYNFESFIDVMGDHTDVYEAAYKLWSSKN